MSISEGNRLIAEFLGYKYYHKGVLVDQSDIGGIYTKIEVFSKVPILVEEFPEDDQVYFKRVPNPDFGNAKSTRWRDDIEFLDWDELNHEEFIYDVKYHSSWDWLMPVIHKLNEQALEKGNHIFGNIVIGTISNLTLHTTYLKVINYLKAQKK